MKQPVDTDYPLSEVPAGARKAIARFCKGKTFPGAWHLYANLAPAEESFRIMIHSCPVFSGAVLLFCPRLY